MSKVIYTNGNIDIVSGETKTITLDTGPGVGTTRVTGNLIVDGDTLTVSAEQLEVSDNIITLNYYTDRSSLPAGVVLRYSGIKVDRGTELPTNFIYDEDDDTWSIASGDVDNYSFNNSRIRTRYLLTDPDTDDGDLTVIGSGIGVIKVLGTLNYEDQITHDDDIPNKKYVDDAIQSQPARQVVQGDSKVIVADVDEAGRDYLGGLVSESEIAVVVDNLVQATFYNGRAEIQGLEFNNTEIVNNDTNTNIILRTNGTGKLEIQAPMIFEHTGSSPAHTSGYSTIHGNPVAAGGTGLYFVTSSINGEIISKSRSLLYSMLF